MFVRYPDVPAIDVEPSVGHRSAEAADRFGKRRHLIEMDLVRGISGERSDGNGHREHGVSLEIETQFQ